MDEGDIDARIQSMAKSILDRPRQDGDLAMVQLLEDAMAEITHLRKESAYICAQIENLLRHI